MQNHTATKQDVNMIIPKPEFISTWLEVTESILIILPVSVSINADFSELHS